MMAVVVLVLAVVAIVCAIFPIVDQEGARTHCDGAVGVVGALTIFLSLLLFIVVYLSRYVPTEFERQHIIMSNNRWPFNCIMWCMVLLRMGQWWMSVLLLILCACIAWLVISLTGLDEGTSIAMRIDMWILSRIGSPSIVLTAWFLWIWTKWGQWKQDSNDEFTIRRDYDFNHLSSWSQFGWISLFDETKPADGSSAIPTLFRLIMWGLWMLLPVIGIIVTIVTPTDCHGSWFPLGPEGLFWAACVPVGVMWLLRTNAKDNNSKMGELVFATMSALSALMALLVGLVFTIIYVTIYQVADDFTKVHAVTIWIMMPFLIWASFVSCLRSLNEYIRALGEENIV